MILNMKKAEKSQQKSSAAEQLRRLSRTERFYGVQLHRSSCRACSRHAGQVYSFENAPSLPVAGCDACQCTCEYLGVVDPRSSRERRSGSDRRQMIRMTTERRHGRDRRSGGNNWIGYDM